MMTRRSLLGLVAWATGLGRTICVMSRKWSEIRSPAVGSLVPAWERGRESECVLEYERQIKEAILLSLRAHSESAP